VAREAPEQLERITRGETTAAAVLRENKTAKQAHGDKQTARERTPFGHSILWSGLVPTVAGSRAGERQNVRTIQRGALIQFSGTDRTGRAKRPGNRLTTSSPHSGY